MTRIDRHSLKFLPLLAAICVLFSPVSQAEEQSAADRLAPAAPYVENKLDMGDCLQRALATLAGTWIDSLQEESGDEAERSDKTASWLQKTHYGVDAGEDSVALRMSWDF